MANFLTSLAPATWLAVLYGLLLLGVAYAIDQMARRASKNVEKQQNSGFTYHEDHDAWLCPEDQWLWPQSFDPNNRVMRYRAKPSICNSCPVKDSCTSSNSGREVQRNVDPWPASESALFHRGIACVVVVLAVIWPLVTMLTKVTTLDRVVLGAVAAVIIFSSMPLWSHLVKSKADPTGVLKKTVDENTEDRAQDAQRYQNRKGTYWSDTTAAKATAARTAALKIAVANSHKEVDHE